MSHEALRIQDLRPFLGQINWQLRRIEKRISVEVEDGGAVLRVELLDGQVWTIGCDACGEKYSSTEKIPFCPKCGTPEPGDGS
jgi:rRNA maturation endonuclease Nob1